MPDPRHPLGELHLPPGLQHVGGLLVDDELAVAVVGLDVAADVQPPRLQVEVGPFQPAHLTAAQAPVRRQVVERVQPVVGGCVEELAALAGGPDHHRHRPDAVLAHYLAQDADGRREVFRQLRDIYVTRSGLVHGGRSYPSAALLNAARDNAYELAGRGLLRAVHHGFPTAVEFNAMILGI
jgi:hypothetical protein